MVMSVDVQREDFLQWVNIAAVADCLVPLVGQFSFRFLMSLGHSLEICDCEADP